MTDTWLDFVNIAPTFTLKSCCRSGNQYVTLFYIFSYLDMRAARPGKALGVFSAAGFLSIIHFRRMHTLAARFRLGHVQYFLYFSEKVSAPHCSWRVSISSLRHFTPHILCSARLHLATSFVKCFISKIFSMRQAIGCAPARGFLLLAANSHGFHFSKLASPMQPSRAAMRRQHRASAARHDHGP